MRIGICAYWFNRGQGVVARQLRSALDSLGHETFVLARPTRAGNIRPGFVDRTGVWDQPRVSEASRYEIPAAELLAWGREHEQGQWHPDLCGEGPDQDEPDLARQRRLQRLLRGGLRGRAGTAQPRGEARERLLDLHFVIDALSDVYTEEGVEVVLRGRAKALADRRPLEVYASGEREAVVRLAAQLRDSG